MKNTISVLGSRRSHRGFSLIELLVVISIIVILAGIVIGAMIKINQSKDAKQTSVTLHNISLRLEDYFTDNGFYPVGEDASSAAVYRALSGDFSGRGDAPTGDVYWTELNDKKNPALVGSESGKRVIRDGFGNTIRYQAALDANGDLVESVKNDSDFDLWSVGPDGEPRDLNTPGSLENELTKDDIWK